MSFQAFVDYNWLKKNKWNAVIVFPPEENVETVLFWYENKR